MGFSKPHFKPSSRELATIDSFQNFAARVGIGTDNQNSASFYGFNPVTRNRLQLEWCYRGSWLAGMVVDAIAEDMTREGVEIQSDDEPDDIKALQKTADRLQIWAQLCQTAKWSRLYGGAIALLMIDGQKTETPLRLDTIEKDQFKGLLPLDRWALLPNLSDLVTEWGPEFGKPKFYQTVTDINSGLPRMTIHHSRVIRLEGVELPYWQRITENLWGQSVLERLWDRMIAFDSTTQGAAQLVYKAHLRTYAIDGLRDIIALGGDALAGLEQQIAMIRRFQSNEGLTLMDTKDKFEVHPYSFAGLSDVLLQFGQQLSGAAQIPLVRLFGQSPAGLNATGESDLRTYFDGILRQQEYALRSGVEKIYDVMYRSHFGKEPDEGFSLDFVPLWQLDAVQKAEVAETTTRALVAAYEAQSFSRATFLRELQKLGPETGVFTTIEDDEVSEAESDPAPTAEALGLALPEKPEVSGSQAGAAGAKPGEERPSGKGLRAVS